MSIRRTKRKDINNPEDIRRIVQAFFERLKGDALLGPYFTEDLNTNWNSFLEIMCSFWENILFYSGGYYGNPMQRHKELHAMRSFTTDHFRRWLTLFCEAVDEFNTGEKADLMKEKAVSIATIMQVKMLE